MKIPKHIKDYRIERAKGFRLADVDSGDTGGLDIDKAVAKNILAEDIKRLAELQQLLYAEHRWALLVIFQAMDAGGKDSAIAHVMSGVNPQGCDVHSFKRPSEEELAHDFMWRAIVQVPRRGHIGIFNRSYYEEVLVTRVHPEVLHAQSLPPALVTKHIWKERFADINDYERYLVRNGILVVKFHLRISREEQRRRFLARIEEPAKRWKFSMDDVAERRLWDRYMDAYEDMIRHTATKHAPWYVVPADHKWFARLVVASALVNTLEALHLSYPKIEGKALRELQKAKKALLAERWGGWTRAQRAAGWGVFSFVGRNLLHASAPTPDPSPPFAARMGGGEPRGRAAGHRSTASAETGSCRGGPSSATTCPSARVNAAFTVLRDPGR